MKTRISLLLAAALLAAGSCTKRPVQPRFGIAATDTLVSRNGIACKIEYRFASILNAGKSPALTAIEQANIGYFFDLEAFSGTVRENLQWGAPAADDETLWAACRAACADEFLERMPKGLDTDLGQGGVNVSGGQKQRLCIARTLLKRPKVLIFDDSTSAVDTATEAKIRASLAGLTDVTKIIIAQRITSVMEADQIVILEDGKVHAVGDHASLLASDPIYQEIYASQRKGGDGHGGETAHQ